MRRNLLIPVAFVIGMFAVSCKSGDKHAIAVPKEATFVFHINAPSLSSKLTWAEIKATNWFKNLQTGADDSLAQQLLDNPENSGINTQTDLAFFAKRRGQGGYAVFQGSLKDAAAFEAFNKRMDKKLVTGTDGDLKVLRGKNVTITWNDSRFMYLFDAPFMATQNSFEGFESSSGSSGKLTSDSLVKFAKELYSLDADNSLYSDKRFEEMMKEQGDMHLWMNAQQFYSGALNAGPLAMISGISKLFEGNVSAGTINFENGKISMKSKSYYNADVAKIYEKYKMKNVDAALLNRIPSQNITGVFSMNYPPEGLPELLKFVGVDGVTNEFLSKINFSVAEFVKANKGDVLLALTDFDLAKKEMPIPGMEGQPGGTYTSTQPVFQVLFAASVNDRPSFEKMIAAIKSTGGEIPPSAGLPPITYSMNDNWFAASTSEAFVNQFLAGGNNNWSVASKLAGHPVVFYVDLQKVMKPMGDSTSPMISESLKMWEDILFTAGEMGGGSFTSNFEVNLVDKSTNSLKQLNQYIDRMSSGLRRGPF